ncbi:TraM recognition domain-containing protein, partial [Halococcus sp. IIIV-5B]|uniref:TraM recognition domain-containing protein n=1 Tax=Halococcus sp. IIIV-5B TaxID=2321230 RepID=UPI000ED921B1
KSGARGVIMVQDVHQLIDTYGEEPARSIWSNCPNRVMFSAGDAETAEFFLSGLGDRMLRQQDVNTKPDGEGGTVRTTSSRTASGKPLLTGELMNQEPGKALIQSPSGWWHAKISEPSF